MTFDIILLVVVGLMVLVDWLYMKSVEIRLRDLSIVLTYHVHLLQNKHKDYGSPESMTSKGDTEDET